MSPLSLYISPCPNDTFSFDALINKRIGHDFSLNVRYLDIEELNNAVLKGIPDICKISYSVYPLISKEYVLLESGSALGRGNGQLLVRRKGDSSPIQSVITPGIHTTAHYLLKRYFPEIKEIKTRLFSEIAEAVENNEADAGVLIHEGRFVYQRRNLSLVADLGQLWEKESSLPLPLGAIVIRRSIAEDTRNLFDKTLSKSVLWAMDHPEASRAYIKEHAQEMEDEVINKHINLFVNQFTVNLGEEGHKAVNKLLSL